jgi:DNA-directed RNA polymerase specialized sigma24 family protein
LPWNKCYDSEKAKPLTWMIAIARNYAIDFYRKKQLPIIDDFDLNVIDDGQIQLLAINSNPSNHF